MVASQAHRFFYFADEEVDITLKLFHKSKKIHFEK
jgi:hypothetical protein